MLGSTPLTEQVLRRFADLPETAQTRYGDLLTQQHAVGVGSGLVWAVGMTALLLASAKAGNAISFGLS